MSKDGPPPLRASTRPCGPAQQEGGWWFSITSVSEQRRCFPVLILSRPRNAAVSKDGPPPLRASTRPCGPAQQEGDWWFSITSVSEQRRCFPVLILSRPRNAAVSKDGPPPLRASTRPCGPAQQEGGWWFSITSVSEQRRCFPVLILSRPRNAAVSKDGPPPLRASTRPSGPAQQEGGWWFSITSVSEQRRCFPVLILSRPRNAAVSKDGPPPLRASTRPCGPAQQEGGWWFSITSVSEQRRCFPVLILSRPRNAAVSKDGPPPLRASTRPCGPAQQEGGWWFSITSVSEQRRCFPVLILSRPRNAAVSKDGPPPLRASTRPCGPAQQEGGWWFSITSVSEQRRCFPVLILSRPRNAAVSKDGPPPMRASTRPCGPAQQEGGWWFSITSVSEQRRCFPVLILSRPRNAAVSKDGPPVPEPAAERGRVRASTRPGCGPAQQEGGWWFSITSVSEQRRCFPVLILSRPRNAAVSKEGWATCGPLRASTRCPAGRLSKRVVGGFRSHPSPSSVVAFPSSS